MYIYIYIYIYIIFYINCPQQFIFYKICSKSEFFFRKLNVYLVTLFNYSLLYKLIQFGMFLFEITLNDFVLTQFLILLLSSSEIPPNTSFAHTGVFQLYVLYLYFCYLQCIIQLYFLLCLYFCHYLFIICIYIYIYIYIQRARQLKRQGTELRAGRPGFDPECRRGGDFSSVLRAQTGPEVHSGSYKMNTGGFPRG